SDARRSDPYSLSLHDALPIYLSPDVSLPAARRSARGGESRWLCRRDVPLAEREQRAGTDAGSEPKSFFGAMGTRQLVPAASRQRSEEHTSELQSRENLVCRLL